MWHASRTQLEFERAMRAVGMRPRQQLVWVKNHFTMGRQDYKWQHEPCFYGWKDGAPHEFAEEYGHPTVRDDRSELVGLSKSELVGLVESMLAGTPTTVIREPMPAHDDLHPTMKPIPLCARGIRLSSKRGDLVLDPFCGSGSTMMACEGLGRRCAAMEYDPAYCDVIADRWERLTGRRATLIRADGTEADRGNRDRSDP